MNDKVVKIQKVSSKYSLRQRYLFVSSIIVILIFAFAWFAQFYVTQNSQQHRNNIDLRQQTSQLIRQLRYEILHIEKGLEAYMWEPSAVHREGVHHAIDGSLHYLEQLQQHDWFTSSSITLEMGDFALDLMALHKTLDRVMTMRLESDSTKPSSVEYDININHSLKHFNNASEALKRISPSLRPQLDSAAQLWAQLHQQVTLYQVKKSGGITDEQANQLQLRIEAIHAELDKSISGIAANPQMSNRGERLRLLTEIQQVVDLLQLSYYELKHDEGNNDAYGSVQYLKHTVEPHFEHLWAYLRHIDEHFDARSRDDTVALSAVANTIVKFVWLLSFFGLFVITIAYLYFQRTVLKPIAMVASAFKSDATGDSSAELPSVHNRETHHLIDAYQDMRQQVQDRQQALEHIAMHDSLTGLPNRYHLMGNLQSLCDSSARENALFCVMMLGLDRFKDINDTLGQHTGDAILKKFGQRLKVLLRENDSVARFASDEFAVLLHNTNREEALYVARKIRHEMEQPFDINDINLSISCSIGIALYPDNGRTKEDLTRYANIAMAIAKQHKTGISFYDERYDTSSVERISLAGKLRQAIHTNTLHLNYQPQYAVHNSKLSGVEVLCRWHDEQSGTISPGDFIPVAEQTGQIHALTEWVLARALEDASRWRQEGLDCGILSVNISAFNLHAPNFITMLQKQLQRWEYPVNRLMLEVTETAMMADPEHAIKTLSELNRLGVKLSIDDYGTGFSSLAYVKQLPVHELKIDKSFVMDMTHDENDAVIVRSTIDLAHNLGLKVVAEGVDSQEKRELLEILDCDYLQGYHLARPLAADEVKKLLPARDESNKKVHHLRDFR